MYSKNMRTSTTQFDIMLNFMEQTGDLISKISNNPRSRIQVIQDWDELTTLLNSDPSGEKKPTEKWKKVWSDLKNNTKRKALKLRAALINGGGAAVSSKALLSDFEQRVINLMPEFVKAVDAGLSEENTLTQDSDRTMTSLSPPQDSLEYMPPVSPQQVFVRMPDIKPTIIEIATPPVMSTNQDWQQPGPLRQNYDPTPEPSIQLESVIPAIEGHIPKYEDMKLRKPTLSRSKQLRRRNTTKLNESFMKYVIQKGRAETEIEKERLRLREIELNIQKQWQVVAAKAIDALHRVIETKLTQE